ncbi:hypothetical protein VF13_41475 [Nostoc linckia z16]|nr:hypothetical protein VF13_41475 [Nostoc linckia z16]
MKSNFIRFTLPIVAAVIASTAAVAIDNNETEAKAALIQGWRRTVAYHCIPGRMCNNQTGPICMDGSYQMFGKFTPTSDCIMILTHQP